VAKIVRGGQTGSADNLNSSQGTFRSQIATIADAVRQLGGNAEIAPGAVVNDPLSAPYVLYVNPFTGKDTFVSGSYSTSGSATERIELQRLTCGYTEARPFKTINRAIIEAGIITAKSYYTSPLTNNDLVSIVLMPGVTTIYNGTGAASVSEWSDGKDPTNAELTEFNPNSTGGVILPRGVSLCGLDLRKTILRPDVVPAVADEAADASNRRAVFKVTGTGYYFGFTFMDKAGSTASHHLLDGFHFASQTELDEFYTKIRQAFGGTNNTGGLDNALAVTNINEYQITGPQPASGSQTISTDTTTSASPYIFNISIRSNYGMCGVYADGDKPTGFKSIVLAQFTAVSLQRDLSCWEKYSTGSWGAFADYDDYISTSPDNVRMDPNRRSFHIRAVNQAVIQEVSVFAIGQGVHHWTQNGGEITITNSNSNFGGCAAISEGYSNTSFAADTDWNTSLLKVADNASGLANNIKRIYLGTVSAISASEITLTNALGESTTVGGVPDIVARDGYTLRDGSYVWIENPLGKDWRSTFSATAWEIADPDGLNITAAVEDEDGSGPGTTTAGVSNAVGKRAYIRRFVDTRTPEQRRYTLKLANTNVSARLPIRDYVLQANIADASIDSEFSASEVLLVQSTGVTEIAGAQVAAEVILRRGNANETWTANTAYKKGQTVKYNNKHFTCIQDNKDAVFTAGNWQESYVHMASNFNPEDFYRNESPIITFDDDQSGTDASTTLGYNFSTVWTSNALVRDQLRSGTDYLSLHLFLTAIGFSSAEAHTILTPQADGSRELDPAVSADMGGYVPSGAANSLDNWAVEFRRPSVIRMFGHAWEWAGFLNYTKAIPKYQGQLSAQNKFTYYFTNVDGGRVYATGFNEEGYQVTPRGLEDIATGETLSVENLGANDITLDTPTEFDNLTLNGTTTINDALVVNATNVTLSSAFNATTTRSGVGEIASIDDIDNSGTATTDSQLNSAGPRFITPEGLNYWKTENQLLSRRSGVQIVYVDPVNGNNRTTAQLLETPPTSFANRAKSLVQLAGYINQVYSPEETVEVRLCPGYYLESGAIRFVPKMYMRSASATNGSRLCDTKDGGSIPFMGQTTASSERGKAWNQTRAYLTNGSNHPIFLTRPRTAFRLIPTTIDFYLEPLSFIFEQDSEVVGCVWLGAVEALINTNVPDSFFSVSSGVSISAVRSAAQGDADNALNYFIKAEVDNRQLTDSAALWNSIIGGYAINARADLSVYNCAFEAMAPASQIGPNLDPRAVIYARNGSIRIRGIWLIGNTKISSELAGAPTYRNDSTYFLTGHHASFLGGYESFNTYSEGFRLSLGGFRETPGGTGDDADYNYTWNNIHLVANDLSYRDAWDPFTPPSVTGALLTETPAGTNWKVIGPGFSGFLYEMNSFSQFELFWHAASQVTSNHAQGFAGIFGRVSLLDDTTPKTKGIIDISSGFSCYGYIARPNIARRAGTGVTPNMSTGMPTNPGEVGSDEDFDDLNMQVTPIKKGIDVNNVVTAITNLKL
jgi:hypothetical protein